MTQKELFDGILAGRMLALVEYRSTVPETVNWRDDSGKAMSMRVVKHTIESGPTSMTVSEIVPDGESLELAAKVPFKKGSSVVLQLETLERVKGSLRARGKLLPYDVPAVKA